MGQSKSTHRSSCESGPVCFLWLYGHRRFPFKLSKNVLREICNYLSFSQLLVTIADNKVLSFCPRHLEWSEEYRLSTPLPHYSKGHAIVYLRDSSIFVCGAGATAHLIRCGKVTELQSMYADRYFHSAIQPAHTNHVYVFGGGGSRFPEPLDSEYFDFDTRQWTRFRRLIRPRTEINACEYDQCIYLVGGDLEGTVELFSLTKGEFSLLEVPLYRLRSCVCVSYIEDGVCLSVAKGTTLQWNLSNKEIVTVGGNGVSEIDAVSSPMALNSVLYVPGIRSCVLISIGSGKMIADYKVRKAR